jgi:hypothetical protein
MKQLIDLLKSSSLDELSFNQSTDLGQSRQGQMNNAFGRLIVQLYDVVIEHLMLEEDLEQPRFGHILTNHLRFSPESITLIMGIATKRKALTLLLEEQPKLQNNKRPAKIIPLPEVNLELSDLQVILNWILNPENVREALIGWAIPNLDVINKLDPYSNLANSSLNSLGHLAG